MHIEVVTLFPELVRDAVKFGVLGRAIERGIVKLGCEDPRAHTRDVHRTVDDRPYGGDSRRIQELRGRESLSRQLFTRQIAASVAKIVCKIA